MVTGSHARPLAVVLLAVLASCSENRTRPELTTPTLDVTRPPF